jgi:hypothetical protein
MSHQPPASMRGSQATTSAWLPAPPENRRPSFRLFTLPYETPLPWPRPRLRDLWWWRESRFRSERGGVGDQRDRAILTGFAACLRRVPLELAETNFRTEDRRRSMAAPPTVRARTRR